MDAAKQQALNHWQRGVITRLSASSEDIREAARRRYNFTFAFIPPTTRLHLVILYSFSDSVQKSSPCGCYCITLPYVPCSYLDIHLLCMYFYTHHTRRVLPAPHHTVPATSTTSPGTMSRALILWTAFLFMRNTLPISGSYSFRASMAFSAFRSCVCVLGWGGWKGRISIVYMATWAKPTREHCSPQVSTISWSAGLSRSI